MLHLINIPFDEHNEDLQALWLMLITCYFNQGEIIAEIEIPTPNEKDSLEILELKYKELDLLFSFSKVVNYNPYHYVDMIAQEKEKVSIEIMKKLKTQNLYRRCRSCGKILNWNFNYAICEKCYSKNFLNQYDDLDMLF
jgi:ATP-dependent RNA helicase SUPV3L1/SUV3